MHNSNSMNRWSTWRSNRESSWKTNSNSMKQCSRKLRLKMSSLCSPSLVNQTPRNSNNRERTSKTRLRSSKNYRTRKKSFRENSARRKLRKSNLRVSDRTCKQRAIFSVLPGPENLATASRLVSDPAINRPVGPDPPRIGPDRNRGCCERQC